MTVSPSVNLVVVNTFATTAIIKQDSQYYLYRMYKVPPVAVIATDSPTQIIFPGALVDKVGLSPTSSTTRTIVSELTQPKLSITSTVMLSPFCKISVH